MDGRPIVRGGSSAAAVMQQKAPPKRRLDFPEPPARSCGRTPPSCEGCHPHAHNLPHHLNFTGLCCSGSPDADLSSLRAPKGVGKLDSLAGPGRDLQASGEALLRPGASGPSLGRGGIEARSLSRDPHSSRVTDSPRRLRASFWRLSQGAAVAKNVAWRLA